MNVKYSKTSTQVTKPTLPSAASSISPTSISQPAGMTQADTSGWKTYTYGKYKLSFDYPSNYTIDDSNDQVIALIGMNQTKDIFISLYSSLDSTQQSKTFLDFASHQALAGCGPIGLNGQVYCDKVTLQTTLQNPNGISGYKLYLRRISGPVGGIATESTVGPVLAYEISKQTDNVLREVEISILFDNKTNESIDPAILDAIGNSLRFTQ